MCQFFTGPGLNGHLVVQWAYRAKPADAQSWYDTWHHSVTRDMKAAAKVVEDQPGLFTTYLITPDQDYPNPMITFSSISRYDDSNFGVYVTGNTRNTSQAGVDRLLSTIYAYLSYEAGNHFK